MTATTIGISAEQTQRLRLAHPSEPGRGVVPDAQAAAGGWVSVNRAYLSDARRSSALAMRDLMREAGVESVASVEQAADLIELAVRVFAPPEGYSGRIERPGPGVLFLSNPACPMFRALDDGGHGAFG